MDKKLKVGILFGGRSAEHEVSLHSAKNVFDALDRGRFDPVLIGIDKAGRWFLGNTEPEILPGTALDPSGEPVALLPQSLPRAGGFVRLSDGGVVSGDKGTSAPAVDVVFPILHGPFGEDGTVQGLLRLADIPFVGSSVLGSAAGMDKDVMKRLLRDAGIPIGKFLVLRSHEKAPSFEEAVSALGCPIFIKPANMGSSVGVSKVKSEADYAPALAEAFKYDIKIIMEEYMEGREIECAVLGNEEPAASVPGEVQSTHEFYSYDAKYLDEHGSVLTIPARVDEGLKKEIQALAVKTFKTLEAEGLSRVDFFLREKEPRIIVNEINTMPGFTRISMYPKLWEASGVSYTELISRLIDLAMARFEKEKKLKTGRNE
jgi:D-alanine-D-alanine ligase